MGRNHTAMTRTWLEPETEGTLRTGVGVGYPEVQVRLLIERLKSLKALTAIMIRD